MGTIRNFINKIDDLFNINNYSVLSYANILKDSQKFKRAGTANGDEFNKFDTPGLKYFKLLFYFGKDSLDENAGGFSSGGLLTPTWNEFIKDDGKNLLDSAVNKLTKNKVDDTSYIYSEAKDSDNFYKYNSAWAYLMLNDEKQRAEHLEQFVNLLSNISSESPWYFYSIEGLNEALDRKPASDGKFEFGDTKKLTIKCLPDAFDNRLTTLLDLYRDITWSWNMKREILPANLRKFDMAIYIYETPMDGWHDKDDNIGLLRLKSSDYEKQYITSYKMLEFHNCEFDYNSIKSGWSTLANEKGVNPEYSIDIKYDDCYEISYNEFIMRGIGDIILNDLYNSESRIEEDIQYQVNELKKRLAIQEGGFIMNAVGEILGAGKKFIENKVDDILMGNLHTYSLTKMASQVKTAMQGGVIQTVQAAKDYVEDNKKRKEMGNKEPASGNITAQQLAALKLKQKPKGNIFSDITLVNNI